MRLTFLAVSRLAVFVVGLALVSPAVAGAGSAPPAPQVPASPTPAGPARAVFELIEAKKYEQAEQKIQAELKTARGEDRDAYLFVLGFVFCKQGRWPDAKSALDAVTPNSEWAAESRFLLQTYAPPVAAPVGRTAGPEVQIEIGSGQTLTVNRDRFSRSGQAVLKNGRRVESPYLLPPESRFNGRSFRGKMEISVEKGRLVLVNSLPVEEYLYGVLKNEVGPGWPEEALKAQAVASRTFVLRRMDLARSSSGRPVRLASDVSIQVYRGRSSEDPRSSAAVDATRGQVLTYGGELIEAVFHSESGGTLESSGDIWGRAYPYLISKPDPYSGASPRASWEAEFDEPEILKALDRSARAKVGRLRNFEVAEKTAGGRVRLLSLTGTRGRVTVPAGKFRLSIGPDRLRSLLWTDFSYKNGRLGVQGRGWGHGVGLSQWSAKSAAEQGLTCAQILKFYFPGTKIVTIY